MIFSIVWNLKAISLYPIQFWRHWMDSLSLDYSKQYRGNFYGWPTFKYLYVNQKGIAHFIYVDVSQYKRYLLGIHYYTVTTRFWMQIRNITCILTLNVSKFITWNNEEYGCRKYFEYCFLNYFDWMEGLLEELPTRKTNSFTFTLSKVFGAFNYLVIPYYVFV